MFNRNKEELTKGQKEKVNRTFEQFSKKEYSEEDVNKVFEHEDKIFEKMNNEKLKGFMEDVQNYFFMLKDFFTGKYKNVPVGTIMAITGSLLYVFLPVDVIPDFIFGIGYIDDAAIIALCSKFVKSDLDTYKEFLKSNPHEKKENKNEEKSVSKEKHFLFFKKKKQHDKAEKRRED